MQFEHLNEIDKSVRHSLWIWIVKVSSSDRAAPEAETLNPTKADSEIGRYLFDLGEVPFLDASEE